MEFNIPLNKKYRYIHLFTGNTTLFAEKILNLYKENPLDMELSSTLFVFVNKDAYEKLSEYENIIYLKGIKSFNADVINFCAKHCDWMFIHNLCCSPVEVLKIRKKARPKIIWRSWGSDVGYDFNSGNIFIRTIKKVIGSFHKRVVSQFYAVGIANMVDKIDIEQRFGKVKTFVLGYSANSQGYEAALTAKASVIDAKKTINVLIGHSGFPNDNHIEILESLLKFKENNIKIYLVLAYGAEQYIQEIKEYAQKTWGDKVVIIDNFLTYPEYAKLLFNMDIAFFDGKRSYALGNIELLTFFRKKIFLNKNGIIKKAFDFEEVPYVCTDEIENLTFEQFIAPMEYLDKSSNLEIKPFSYYFSNWKKLIDELNQRKS